MNKDIDCSIILGGKTENYFGKFPGILEEAKLSFRSKMPVFLIGGFGGATKIIVDLINKNKIKTKLSEELIEYFSNLTISDLNNGLDEIENNRLFTSINYYEIIALILKGIKRVFMQRNEKKTL